MSLDLNSILKAVLAEKKKVDIGQFQLLNLDRIKDASGDNWPAMKKKIFEAASHFIEKRLSIKHILVPCEEGFLIIFAEHADNIAEEVENITQEMISFFLGHPDLPDLQVEADAQSVSPGELAQIATDKTTPAAPRKVADAPAMPSFPPLQELGPGAETTQAAFRPIWDAERQAITANYCFAKVHVEGRLIDGRRAIETRMSDVEHLTLDLVAAQSAFQAFLAFFRKKKRNTFAISIHETTVLNPESRARFLECLEGVPEVARKSFWLRLEVADIPQADALPAVQEFGDQGFSLMIDQPFGQADLSAFEERGISLFSTRALKPANFESEGMLDHDTVALNNTVRAAGSLSAPVLMDEVRDLKTLKQAMACGVRMLCGTGLVPEAARPSPLRSLSIVDLCRISKAA